jgi:hypothetical protein
MKSGTPPPSLSMTVAAPNGLGRACRLWSVCVCRRPGDFFDSHDATAATVDAPHSVQKEDEKPPQRNELKASFGELVVTGRWQMATRADCGRTLARSYGHFDALLVGTEMGLLVDKTSETMAAVRIVISSMVRKRVVAKPLPQTGSRRITSEWGRRSLLVWEGERYGVIQDRPLGISRRTLPNPDHGRLVKETTAAADDQGVHSAIRSAVPGYQTQMRYPGRYTKRSRSRDRFSRPEAQIQRNGGRIGIRSVAMTCVVDEIDPGAERTL